MQDTESGLLECFKENWQHARHVENERIGFTQFFAMIVGAAVTIAFQSSSGGPSRIIALAIFIIFLALLGLLLTDRWGQTFDTHMGKAARAAERLGLTDYVVTPGQYRGLSWFFRTRYLFCYYYAVIIALASGAILYSTVVPDLYLAVGYSALLFVFIAAVITLSGRRKRANLVVPSIAATTEHQKGVTT